MLNTVNHSPAAHHLLGRVLVVDDDETICDLLEAKLEANGFMADVTTSLAGLREKVKQRFYDAILLDIFLDDEDGLEVLPFLVKEAPYSKVIMMSAHGTIELAVNALEKGATSFISKTKDSDQIIQTLINKCSHHPHESDDASEHIVKHDIVGQSQAVQSVIEKIHQIRDVDSTVLLVGESGTGKELMARAIHANSKRTGQRFEAVNCGAIPENLLESELFGHKRGAFTDAKTDRKGLFEICENGTLFLDEIGDMPIGLQVKLNRVLQEREIMPLGSSRSVKVNTRVLAATNKHLPTEVQRGNFREDLYYRLAVLKLELAPLRERRDDIPILIDHFLHQFNKRFSKSVHLPSKEVELRLAAYDWPGNIRQLQNAVERGVILSSDGELHLTDMISIEDSQGAGHCSHSQFDQDFWLKPLSDAKKGFEKDYLKHLLEVTRGNISEMARLSGRYRADVYRLLTKYDIEWEEFRS